MPLCEAIGGGVHFHYEERFLNDDDGDDDKEGIVINIWANGTIVGILKGNNTSRLALVTYWNGDEDFRRGIIIDHKILCVIITFVSMCKGDEVGICASFPTNQVISVSIRDGHADADRMPIQNMRSIYRAISNICRIMRIYPHRCASAIISAWPSLIGTLIDDVDDRPTKR